MSKASPEYKCKIQSLTPYGPRTVYVKASWHPPVVAYEGDSVIPAQAGIQKSTEASWIPAFAGMTAW